MPSVTFAIPDEIKAKMRKISWVNWSEVARRILLKRLKKEVVLKKLSALMKNSEMTEELAMKLGEELKERIHKRLKS